VLETEKRRKEKNCKGFGCVQLNSSSVWHTGLSGGAQDSVRCARQVSCEKATLGKSSTAYDYNSPDCPVVHRTVRSANGRQHNGRPRNPRATRGPRQQSAGGTGLSGAPTGPEVQRSSAPEKEGYQHRTIYSDCPVRHSTEGKDGLPCWPPTAPSYLGAIKGTPRRMEEIHNHSLSILRHPDFFPAHSFHRVSDLSSIRVEDSMCCHLSSSPLLCAWVCYDLCLVCVAHPNLTSCFHCDLCCKGERLQSCGDSSQTGIII
jgi:hypothetical protein